MATKSVLVAPGAVFDLDKTVTLDADSSLTVEVSGASDHDVFDAIVNNQPFPDRPEGKIPLGRIDLKAQTGKNFTFGTAGAAVAFKASAEFQTGMGVFNFPADATASLQLVNTPRLNLAVPGADTDKFLVMMWGYNLQAVASGSHPIGVLGTVTFGAEGAHDFKYAVLHRFPKTTGAFQVIDDTVKSWRLPRQLGKAGDLKPGTWLVAEVDGSLAINLAAQLGYDFNLVHEARQLGLTRNLGAKIDAGLKVTFGFDVSGRYLVIVGRECRKETDADSGVVRLQLFKQSKRGFDFGLNLSVGVTGPSDIPNYDDLVKAVFGIHGAQVVKDLHLIKDWTDPNKDLGQTVARLLNDTGLQLLTKATGIDAKAEFERARQMVLGELAKWDALPDRVAAATWRLLGKLPGDSVTQDFKTFLSALADNDPGKRRKAFTNALQSAVYGDDPRGQWLSAVADEGLLALSSQLDKVQTIAAQTLDILNGGIIKRIQDFIHEKLDLSAIRDAVTQNDFDKLDGWLIKRLGDFFDKDLHFEDLKQIQAAINLVFTKADDIQNKVQKAIRNRFGLELAATYSNNTTNTALLDASFDLRQPPAADMFKKVVANSQLDTILTRRAAGVSVNSASLSHEVQRTGAVQINMPFFSFESTHVNDSLATLTASADAGRVMVELKASDLEMVKNRFRSELSVLCKMGARNGKLQFAPDDTESIAYEMRQAKANLTLVDFEHRVTPFITEYLLNLFSAPNASLQTFYTDLDRTVENVLHNGTNNFGDVAITMQVAAPAAALQAWFVPRDPVRIRRDNLTLSRAIQHSFRTLLPFYYFQEDSKLVMNITTAALLVWSAMPISTWIDFDVQTGAIRQLNRDDEPFWDWPNINLRRAVVRNSHTTASLTQSLLTLHKRLLEAGNSNAPYFAAKTAPSWQQMSLTPMGDELLHALLYTESQIIDDAVEALIDVNDMLDDLDKAPMLAMKRFADFGARLTEAFHHNLQSVYGDDSLRALSAMLLVEGSRAIAPELALSNSSAMLNILTLTNNHAFDLSSFLAGELPPKEQVALAQTLVNI